MTLWYRAYAKFLDDPKIQTLSDKEFRIWQNCLYLACRNNTPDGKLGTLQDVSFALRETVDCVSETFHTFLMRGLVETVSETLHETDMKRYCNVSETVSETFRITGWLDKRYKGDNSTERVKRFRNVSSTKEDKEKIPNPDPTPPPPQKPRELTDYEKLMQDPMNRPLFNWTQ